MALVVLLRGVNVGGHRVFRPSVLAKQLQAFDVVNVGAAGTFVARRPVTQARLRAEIVKLLPFETDVMICTGRDVLRLTSANPFAGRPARTDVTQFVSVLAKRRRLAAKFPLSFPADGDWGVQILGCQGPFVFGVYRRDMKAISHLGRLDKMLDTAVTTRSWSTFQTIARILTRPAGD